MADRGHTDGNQVLGRQVRQDVPVDFAVAERRLVLLKTEPLQPARDIDRHLRSHLSGRSSIRRSHHDRNRAASPYLDCRPAAGLGLSGAENGSALFHVADQFGPAVEHRQDLVRLG
jgi:hypothetical protein